MLIHIRNSRKISSLARHALHSPNAYSSLSSQLPQEEAAAAAREVASLLKTPNWEKNTTLKSLASHMNPHIASQVISLHSNQTNTCLRFFTWVSKHSSYCFSPNQKTHLLKLIVSSGLYQIAHSVILALIREFNKHEREMLKLMSCFDQLRDEAGFRLNYPCYSSLLMSLAKLDLGLLAYSTYKRMEADGFLPGEIDYRTIVNALCKNGFTESAEMFMCRILKIGFVLDSHICTSLVLGFCRVLNLGEALRVFNVMSREEVSEPNSVTYSNLIHGLCEVGRLNEAFVFKEQMGKKGCEPSTRTNTVLIKALCDEGLVEKGFTLFDEMRTKGCKANVHTYTVLIDGLCREGKVEEANGVYRKMCEDGVYPSVVTYNALINGYCKDGRIVQAFEVLAVMEKRGCRPNVRSFNELMGGLCRVGKPFKAVYLLKRMVGDGLAPDVVSYNVLIDGVCREGFMNVAYKLLGSMSSFDVEPDCVTFTGMIDGLCKQGKVDVASSFLSLMVRKGIKVDEVTCTVLIDGFCKLGKTKDALFIVETLCKMRLLTTPHSLNVLLDVLSKGCKVKEELAMFGKINKLGLVPSVVTYTTLVEGLIRSGDVSGSLRMLEAMKSSGCLPNVYPYTIIINGLCRFGRVEEAEKLLATMRDSGVSPNHVTYTVMVKGYVDNGKLDRALETVSVMVARGYELNERVYSSLLHGLALSQNKLISMVEELGGSTRGVYGFVVTRLCKEGRIDESNELIQTMLKIGVYNEKAIDTVIESYCGRKEQSKCVELITLVLGTGFVPSFRSFCLVIQGLKKEGESEQARELVMELLRSSGVVEKSRMLDYVECLMEGDGTGDCSEVIDQLHFKERPIF
ncbi:pentatricopeptide repeat-containing protein At3g07290, mitochondrial-like [Brassica napus]|uniref:pentatricopeptide repeat-containing protein At3g07290, mitochondrial-like n=1 Tax=Brassica napus TaxID=3708 RepID=UPI002078721D|nr:pentatricopeptide repeat-containing protein At3g07290, mitochondrial-like [Brassica napus]XP_048616843.1 pentatricopeptide repeat-containing protein At3g07290, mitochondrial-like [Brassica napus]XP_048616865.1 pentatricopeptide repeat-containing protein At3g07290, mitochondrial-like [Brassica napus]XP_048616886.1 pentatricopeptide repeat-containing protein At3g07290, mitochondrial-like [Brassica napus]